MKLKVFGIGLNRTASLTLRDCLVPLGYNHLGASKDLLTRFRNGDLETVLRMSERYDVLEDWPWPLLYRELFERYGDRARYVLTRRRSAAAWLADLKALAEATRGIPNCRLLAYGYEEPHGHEREHLELYERHLTDVRTFFRTRGASHLLLEVCWEEEDDWGNLSRLLGMEVPGIPFPGANLDNSPLASANLRAGWPHLPYIRPAAAEPNQTGEYRRKAA